MYGSAVYDDRRDRLVFFGGGVPDADSWTGSNTAWELPFSDSIAWRLLLQGVYGDPRFPEPREFHSAAYDAATDRMIVVGGYVPGAFQKGPWRGVWALDLATRTWSGLALDGDTPPLWRAPVSAFDSRHRRLFVAEGGAVWGLELAKPITRPSSAGAADPLAADETAGAAHPRLALRGGQPNPASGPFTVEFSLPDRAPATIELMDIAGRRVWHREVGSLGAGEHAIRIGAEERLSPGIYLIRLANHRSSLTRKLVKLEQ